MKKYKSLKTVTNQNDVINLKLQILENKKFPSEC